MRAGDQFAAGPGLATVLPDFDFETFSEAGLVWDAALGKWHAPRGFASTKRGLPAVGVRPYVEHTTFRPLLLVYDLKDGAGPRQWEFGQWFDVLAPLFDHVRRGGLLEAHNSSFEWTVWQYFCVPRWGWPPLIIEQLRCSAAKSRAAGYPGALANVAAVLKVPTQKDADGTRLMKLFSIPRNPTKKDPRTITQPHEAPDEWARYKAYNVTDIVAESQVSVRVPDLTPFELDVWLLDQRINDRGMQIDLAAVDDCMEIVERASEKYGAEIRQITGGIEATELQQLKGWLHSQGIHLDDMTSEAIDEAIKRHEGAGPSPGLRALQIRQMLGSASVKKLYALAAMAARDGRVHDMYLYMATHHGRTGGYGPQPANLYKGEWHTPEEVDIALQVLATRDLATVEAAYPDLSPLDVVNNVLRSLFIAAPGHDLISSDYSAIEGVTLAALAGEQWILDVFHGHGMIYEAQIARMTGVPFEEFVEHKRRTGKHHPLRQQGKLAVLSGVYCAWIGGWKNFGADQYYEDDAAIKAAILAYRDSVPHIVEFWGGQTRDKFKRTAREERYGLEGAAISAVLSPGTCYRVRLIGFQVYQDVLYMQLPSGRLIPYHAPRLRPSTWQYADPWELELTYEGWNANPARGPSGWERMLLGKSALTQNAAGGTARDIMQHGMLNLARAGYPVVMQTYDEAVAEVPHGWGSVEEFEACLNDLPTWAKGWPVRAKGGWRGPRYGKWD